MALACASVLSPDCGPGVRQPFCLGPRFCVRRSFSQLWVAGLEQQQNAPEDDGV